MSEKIDCSGLVTSVYYCAFLIDYDEPWKLESASYQFTLLHLRFSNDMYEVIDQEIVRVMDFGTTNKKNTGFDLRCQYHNFSGMNALEGDQFGAIISAECDRNSLCPLGIGLINTGCENTTLFFPNQLSSSSDLRGSTIRVAIKLNFQVQIGQLSYRA